MAQRFHSSYLAGGLRGSPFLAAGFGDPAARAARVEEAARRGAAPELVEALLAQDAGLPPGAARRANLEALGERGTVVVATGQQVGLFLGPLYTLYKAATAVAAARLLARESGRRVAPLFWLQTEDHDFAEIDHCVVPRPGGALTLRIAPDDTPERASVAGRRLGADVAERVGELAAALEGLPCAAETVALFRAAYRPGQPLGRAFAEVLAALFAEDGLVVLDPRDPRIARLAAPILRQALFEHARIAAALEARAAALRAAGFDEQVRTRPGVTLPFYHPEGALGPRYRLEVRPGGFALPDGRTVEPAALEAALANEPLRLSTSALLRPIVQDALLPTCAYVGGPAEIDYLAQAAALYPLFGVTPALAVPRARFRLIPPGARRRLQQLGLRPAEIERPRDALLHALAGARGGEAAPGPHWIAELEARLDAYAAGPGAGDPALVRAAARTRESARRALARLERRHQRAVLAREQGLAERVTALQDWLWPGGAPQERVHALPYYAALVGPRALVERVLAAVDPLDPAPQDLAL